MSWRLEHMQLVITWIFFNYIKMTWPYTYIYSMKFQKLLSWNNTKLQSTIHLAINVSISSSSKAPLNCGLQHPSSTCCDDCWKKHYIFLNCPLHNLKKILGSNMCRKLPCLKINSIQHLTSRRKVKNFFQKKEKENNENGPVLA